MSDLKYDFSKIKAPDRIAEITQSKKNIFVRMWIFAACVVAAVFLFTLWENRFQAKFESEEFSFALLGIEQNGRVLKNFSGKNLAQRLSKIGLNFRLARAETFAKLAEKFLGNDERGNEFGNVPTIWIFASGKTSEAKDKAYESFGEAFFSKENFCFSIVDENGFSLQLDSENWTIFHSKTSDAIAAIPVLKAPSGAFSLRVEARERGAGTWKILGEFLLPAIEENFSETAGNADEIERGNDEEEISEEEILPETVPEILEIRRICVPEKCRFFSENRENRSAFGEIEIALKMPKNSRISALSWRLENLEISAAGTPKRALGNDKNSRAGTPSAADFFGNDRASIFDFDAFHTNVRFLAEDDFSSFGNGILRVPISKTLFPKRGENWEISAVLVRENSFLPEEILDFETLKIGRSPTRKVVAGTTVFVRAFPEKKYFRLLANGVPALVLEISGTADLRRAGTIFCQPFRVKSEDGEDLLLESVVLVKPGVYQYWFLPRKIVKSLSVSYAITRPIVVSGTLEAEIKP